MEVTKFKYSLDRRSKRITWGIIVLIVGLAVVFHFVWGTSYIPAWFLLFLLCIITLYILSFSRYLTIDDDALQIHCIVELTRIHVEEIEKIRRIDQDYFRRMIPLIGSYGFGDIMAIGFISVIGRFAKFTQRNVNNWCSLKIFMRTFTLSVVPIPTV